MHELLDLLVSGLQVQKIIEIVLILFSSGNQDGVS